MFTTPVTNHRRRAVSAPCALLAGLVLASSLAAQQGVGVLADRGRVNPPREPYIHVFDPDTLQITASIPVPLPAFGFLFDVEISPDLQEAYVSDNTNDQIWVVDLSTNPPVLASGVNPIQMNGGALDITLTPDGRFLIAGSGNATTSGGSSLAVVDLQTRTQVQSLPFDPYSPIAVEAAHDGSVLVVELIASQPSFANTNVRRFRIDAGGTLSDTGDLVDIASIPGVQNVIVPYFPHLPRFLNRFLSRHTLHISRPAGGTMGSLKTRGLRPVDDVMLDYPTGIDMHFDPLRSIVYARTNESETFGPAGAGNARIDGYWYNPLFGRLGPRIVSIDLDRKAGTAFGAEQTALDARGRKVFVSGLGSNEVRAFDSLTGHSCGTITHPDFLFGTGLRVRRR